ncbi:MAG: GNAT family N-acetyltransferase [Bdellovibrionaceae bacterium]|nr:GNAT family N-acetyltransferase [Pseudobdellovibrionaceae bacterium]
MVIFPKPPREIETERLLLRARDVNQAREMFALIQSSREHLRPWMPWEEQTKSVDDSKDYLALATNWWETGRNFDFSVYEKKSGEMIGSFGLHTIDWANRSCHVGFWMGARFAGKGFVSEALRRGEELARELGFHRVVLTCDGRNEKSAAVARRNQYSFEARQLDDCVDRGRTRDTLYFVKLLNPPVADAFNENLPEGFTIVWVSETDFWPRVEKTMEAVFDENEIIVRPQDLLSDAEKSRLRELNQDYRRFYAQYLLLLKDGELAGWSWGYQDNRDSFYMVNSAVLKEHRGRGLYSRLLDVALSKLVDKGFQKIWSRHNMTNNAILIPKMKKGFVITGTELTDTFGTLVHLSYFTNPERRRILDFRSGSLRPDAAMKKRLGL